MKMKQTHPTDRLEFQVRRRFPVTVERLYAAWVEPSAFGKWITPKPFRCTGVLMDLQTGGRYSVAMESFADTPRITGEVAGEFLVIDHGRTLEMTWLWSLSDLPATRVSVTFEDEGAAAVLHLRHYDFIDPDTCADYRHGWDQSFQNLKLLLNGTRP